MPTSYEKTNVLDRAIARVVKQWHQDLDEAKVTFNVLWAVSDDADEPAIKKNGLGVIALIKVNNLKDRVSGLEDATLIVDKRRWDAMQDEEQTAVLDHELTHLEVKRKKTKEIKRDDVNRPALGLRPHDFEIGAFRVVVERHKGAAIEGQAVTEAAKWMATIIQAWG